MPGTIRSFEQLPAWQAARKLVRAVYTASNDSQFRRDFGLRDQIRKAAVSIMANIAEGFSRHSDKDFVRFLFMAKASAAEVQSHLYVALDQEYLMVSRFEDVFRRAEECAKQLSGLISYLSDRKTIG